jgi:hypothetical protein
MDGAERSPRYVAELTRDLDEAQRELARLARAEATRQFARSATRRAPGR